MKVPKSLETEITAWMLIEKKHFDDYTACLLSIGGSDINHDRLHAKAQMVVAALRHYKIEYERQYDG